MSTSLDDDSYWVRSGIGHFLRTANPLYRVYACLLLSRAKHRSLAGHPRIAQRMARLVRSYDYPDYEMFGVDDAPGEVIAKRTRAFEMLGAELRAKAPQTNAAADEVRAGLSDAEFVDKHRVPFQFRDAVRRTLPAGGVAVASRGRELQDVDGNWSYDLGGSYGVNLFGTEFYKQCIQSAVERAASLGVVLGAYHPIVADNVHRLRRIAGMDEISFHMSGTEAVMQAVRLSRYHTKRSHVVRFAGAYHGWWDGVQAGPGNPRPPREVYTLSEMSDATLRVLEKREDIACVLVNPIQAMHPNRMPPSDAALVAGVRHIAYDRDAYTAWLQALRKVCTRRRIVLIFDEVFLGFRLALGGAQEYFNVRADLVTYGKTLGGGLPVGVLAGQSSLMRRSRDSHPGDVCFARGTFNAHPYVMTAMNEFLRYVETPPVREHYTSLESIWNARAILLNERLSAQSLPVRVVNMASVWSVTFSTPGRFNWLLQYYLRAEGLSLSWVGTGRLIFSHDTTDHDMRIISERFIAAATRMQQDGWWWTAASVTAKSINRLVLREVASAALRESALAFHPAELRPGAIRTRPLRPVDPQRAELR